MSSRFGRTTFFALVFATIPSLLPAQTISVSSTVQAEQVAMDSAAHTLEFLVTNSAATSDNVRLACRASGAVTACRLATITLEITAGGSATVRVAFARHASGTGAVMLEAESGTTGVQVNAEVSVTIASPPGVSVDPDGSRTPIRDASAGEFTETFTVTNTGGSPLEIALTCESKGVATCVALTATRLTLDPGASATVEARYRVSGTGNGAIVLRASANDGALTESGRYHVFACSDTCRSPAEPSPGSSS
jgi:hypothetical protein